nr:hypothetical protein [Tanacetum cinerariifolium]
MSLPDEHQLWFSKHKTAQELWAAILKTFGGNEATKKTKKNLLKQQYDNFKAEGSETLEQTFNRLQVIVSQLQFMDVEIEQDDLNQKFLTSLAPKWLMHTIVWRNRSDLDTMSLDDLYNHLKVYEFELQMKSKPNSQNMAFISSAKDSRGNKEVNTASVSTASTNVPTASANIGNMALLSMRADRFWKKIGKKISIQGSDVAGFDKSKVECFNCHKMGHFARECRAPRSQDRGRRDNYRQGSKVKEQAPKALMAIDRVGWDWSYMANDEENHALIADEETPTEFALMAKTSAERLAQVESRLAEQRDRETKYCEKIRGLELKVEFKTNTLENLKKEVELIKKEKEELVTKLTGFKTASKDLDSLLESQRMDKNKEGLGYSAVPPPPAQLYSSPKKDLSWTGLPEFKDDTVTDYSRPSPAIESTSDDTQNKNPYVTETKASPSTISPKSFIKFVKAMDSPTNSKTDKAETTKKSSVKYAEQYRKPTNKPNVIGNQRNWNNLKTHQLGPNFVIHKKACFNCGDFNHLAYDCRKRMKKGTSRSQNNTHKSPTPRPVAHRLNKPPMRPVRTNMNGAWPNRTSFNKQAHSYTNRSFQRTSVGSFQNNIDDKGYWDSGCSRHMTGNVSYISDYEPFDGGYVSFGQGGCKITGKRTIKTGKLEFKNVYFVKDLKDFKLLDDANVLLRTPKQHNMYSIDLNNIISHKDLTCLVAKASADECMIWHRRQEAVNTAGYVQNRVLVNKSHNKTPYELFNGTKDAAGQEVKKDVSTLRYIALPNWAHDALLESSSSKPQDDCSTDVPESSGNSNPTATPTNLPADQVETLTVETPILTTPSLDNILTLTNWFEDILGVTTITDESNGVEADVSNMEISITASPTPTLRIHKDHPKSQTIGPVDTPIQTRNKSKEVGEQNPSWVEAMQEELLQFKIQKVWSLVDCPKGEDRIDYDEVFAPVARIEAIRLFLAYASFMGFTFYQMDVKSAFLYGTIDEEIYVMQPLGFQDSEYLARVYKVEKSMYGLHQAPRAWKRGDFILVQVYVDDIIFGSSNPQLCREFEALMHKKFQMSAMVKRIFRYLKGHPKLGLWYPKESPFDLVAYSDSDYGGATQDRKSTTGGCQFLGRRLISWQCKKQTIVATSTTEAEYVAAASVCGQVLWIQNQLLDYGYNFMSTKTYIDNNSAIYLLTKPFDVGRFQYLVVKEYQAKDKIGSKPDKNGKHGEAGKSQKQLQWIKEEKLKKMKKEGPEMQSPTSFINERQKQGLNLQLLESFKSRDQICQCSKAVTEKDFICNIHILVQRVFLDKLQRLKTQGPANTADAFDEYLQMSVHIARDALSFFNMCIIELYMPKYLRKPTSEDVVNIQQKHNNVYGFSGMLGSID